MKLGWRGDSYLCGVEPTGRAWQPHRGKRQTSLLEFPVSSRPLSKSLACPRGIPHGGLLARINLHSLALPCVLASARHQVRPRVFCSM